MIYFLEDDPSIRKLVIYTLNSQGMEQIEAYVTQRYNEKNA